MDTPPTETKKGQGSTSGGGNDFLDFESQEEVTDAAVYLELVRQTIGDGAYQLDQSKFRSAIVRICAAQIERDGQVDTAAFAWLADHNATHLDTLFPGIRDPTHDPADFPSSIGRFILLGIVGVGGYAVVYSAMDVKYRRSIAIKALRTGAGANERPRKLMKLEAKIMKETNCAHIVRVYNSYEIGRETLIAMEMVSGGNLARLLSTQGKLDRRHAAEMARQVAAGVEAAHALGVIHRDLKPGNILFDGESRWCVGDFGLAKKNDEVNSFSTVARMRGTRAYASPEQLDLKDASERSDTFAIGLVLFESITGVRAFKADGVEEQKRLIKGLVGINTRHNRQVMGADLLAIVLKCLQPFPEHRYQSVSELRLDLANYLAGKPLTVLPPTAWEEVKRFTKHYRATTFAAIAALVVAFLLSLVFVEGWARRRMGVQLLRQGQISLALGELADSHANARKRAIKRLTEVVAAHGTHTDLTDPFAAAMLKRGMTEVWSVPGQHHLAFDVTADGMKAAVARTDGGIDVIDRATNETERLSVNSDQPAIFAQWSRGGEYLAVMNELPPGSTNDDRRPFAIVDLQTKKTIDEIPLGIHDEGWAFSPDGRSLAVADAAEGAIRYFDLKQRVELSRFPIPDGSWVRGMVFLPDGDSVVIAYANSGEVEIRTLTDGALLDKWRVPYDILDVEASTSGKIAIAAGSDAYFFRRGLSQAVAIVHAHDALVNRIRFSQRGDRFATHCNRGQLKVWDTFKGTLLIQGSSTRHLRFVSNDTEIAGVFSSHESNAAGFGIASFEREKLCRQIRIAGSRGGVRSISLNDHGTALFAATNGGTAKVDLKNIAKPGILIDQLPCADVCAVGDSLFSSRRFAVVLRSIDSQTDSLPPGHLRSGHLRSYPTRDHHYGSPLVVDSVGKTIAVVQAATDEIVVIQSDQPARFLPAANLDGLAISRDGRFLAGAQFSPTGVTQIWSLDDDQLVKEIHFAASNIQFVGSRYLLLGGVSEYQLWDRVADTIVHQFPRIHQSVEAPLAVSETVAAIVTSDIAIELYDSTRWSKLLTLPMDTVGLKELKISPNGSTLAALNRNGSINVFDLQRFATEFDKYGLDWPIPAIDQNSIPFETLPLRNVFIPMPTVEWISGAKAIRLEAAPVHRRIESLLVAVSESGEEVSAGVYEELAHKYLWLGGLHESRRYFQLANATESTAERIYFAGLLSLVLGDRECYLRLRETVDVDMIRRDGFANNEARLCLLLPAADPQIIQATIDATRKRLTLNRPSEEQWLATTLALALVRDHRAVEAVDTMRAACDNQFGSLDLFEKSVAALALRHSRQSAEADEVMALCNKYPQHRYVNLRLYAEILLNESAEMGRDAAAGL